MDISAAIAWAAKYVDRKGFCVFQPAGSETWAPVSSSLRSRSPANAASGSFAQSIARIPIGFVQTALNASARFNGSPPR